MKQNNKQNKFNRNYLPEKSIPCDCGDRAKLKIHRNYSFGKKSKAVISQFYKCEKCGSTKFLDAKNKRR